MGCLRWLGGVIVFFWLLGVFFKIFGPLIHLLLIAAVIVFLYDFFFNQKR